MVAIVKLGEKYDVHEVVGLFPEMSPDEYSDLLTDVKEHGVREPVAFWCGKLVDGRHRLKAATEAGFVCPRVDLDPEEDPIAWVTSANLKRRNLSASERAVLSAKMTGMKHGTNQYSKMVETPRAEFLRRSVDVFKGKEDTPVGVSSSSPPVTIEQAAKAVGVSPRSVNRAKAVLKSGNKEVIEKLESGQISLREAEDAVKPKEEKAEPAPEEQAKKTLALVKDHLNKALRGVGDVQSLVGRNKKKSWNAALDAIKAAIDRVGEGTL